jgi:hypothetical protein
MQGLPSPAQSTPSYCGLLVVVLLHMVFGVPVVDADAAPQ